jgi:hypothetical protein
MLMLMPSGRQDRWASWLDRVHPPALQGAIGNPHRLRGVLDFHSRSQDFHGAFANPSLGVIAS